MLEQYTAYQWLSFFFVYSFLGWIFESAYVSLKSKKLTNRGFLKGPFLPIYGSGAVMMLFVSEPFKDQILLTYIAGVVGATLLELATGAVIEAIFKVRYWDYSNQKFQFKGYICLSSSVAWGFFTIGMDEWLHPAVLYALSLIPATAGEVLFALTAITFQIDTVLSVREAIDMRELLVRMENMRYEMQLLRKRADVVMAVVDDEWHSQWHGIKDPATERFGELKGSLDVHFDRLKQSISEHKPLSVSQQKEIEELFGRFGKLKSSIQKLRRARIEAFRQRILGNPTMISTQYRLSLDFLKHRMKEESESTENS